MFIKVPRFYDGYNTSLQGRVWVEISVLVTFFGLAVMVTRSFSQ
jgi:hypothetical protein